MKFYLLKNIVGIFILTAAITSAASPIFAEKTTKTSDLPEYSEIIIITGNDDEDVSIYNSNIIENEIECYKSILNDRIIKIKNDILQKINNGISGAGNSFDFWDNDRITDFDDKINTNEQIDKACDKITVNSNETAYSEYIIKVIELTNAERAKYKLLPLKLSDALCKSAQEHADDMYINNYFSHVSQDGRTMSDRIAKYCLSYNYKGENIAMGYSSPETVVEGWMNSDGHKANILNTNYTEIGIGYNNGYWVQNFGG